MVLPSYCFQLTSNNCTASTASNANNNKEYYVDWSQLPQGKYAVTWTMNASNNTFGSPIVTAFVHADLETSNTFLTTNTNYPATRTRCIGSLFVGYSTSALNSLYADLSTNPPIYLNSRPSDNVFNVSILTNTGALWLDKATTPIAIRDYVLNLNFELLEVY